MTDLRETTWNYIAGDTHGYFYTAERKWLTKIQKWKEERPEEVEIQNTNPDGSMVVRLPVSYFKISPKKRIDMSEEHKSKLLAGLEKHREKLKVNK